MQMLGGREGMGGGHEEGGSRSYGRDSSGGSEGGAERPARAPAGKPAASKPATGFDDMDDDIPF
jgi:single-strand DNA-binding protein